MTVGVLWLFLTVPSVGLQCVYFLIILTCPLRCIWQTTLPIVFSYEEITVPIWDLGIGAVCTSEGSIYSSLLMSGGIVGCGWAVLGMKSTLDGCLLGIPSGPES